MKKDIHKFLEEELKTCEMLSESAKIRRGRPTRHGYPIFITSDEPVKEDSDKETANIGWKLNMSSKTKRNWKHNFNAPIRIVDPKSGKWGWGYLIHSGLNDDQVNQLLSNLKVLVAEWNKFKKVEEDLETAGLNVNQIKTLEQVVDATPGVETSKDLTTNSQSKANLEKYLSELNTAIESDEVFEYLIKTLEQVQKFHKNNEAWNYSFLNSLIITKADPTAVLAGPTRYWNERNYRIKDEFKGKGIVIKKGTSRSAKDDIKMKVQFFKNNPQKFEEYKREMGIPANVTFSDYARKNAYKLAMYATKKKLVKSQFGFAPAFTYTDTMVEPIPGKEVDPITSDDDLYVREKDIDSKEMKEKMDSLFNSLFHVAQQYKINTAEIDRSKSNINELNKLLNAITLEAVSKRFNFKLKGMDSKQKEQYKEVFKAYAEMVSFAVKRNYGLPSEASKYNVANLLSDRDPEERKQDFEAIMDVANKIVLSIDEVMSGTPKVNEFREFVRDVLKEIYFKD